MDSETGKSRKVPPALWLARSAAVVGAIAVFALADLLIAEEAASERVLRVGAFENPPIVSSVKGGRASGLAVEVLEHIARREGWRLQFFGAPWAEQLKNLAAGEIDILVGVAHDEERAQRYAFSRESLIGNWGIVYTRTGANIHSPLDLHKKRVALMTDAIHTRAFDQLMRDFGVRYDPVFFPRYEDTLRSASRRETDAAVINRILGVTRASQYDVAPTGIVFNPIYIHYAAPLAGDPSVLAAIDRHLEAMKQDKGSAYYRALAHWLRDYSEDNTHAWWQVAAVSLLGLLLAAVVFTWLLRRQIRNKTVELEAALSSRLHAERRANEIARHDGLTGLPNRLSFNEDFEADSSAAQRHDKKLAVFLLNIDRIKHINDSLGHVAGDQLLCGVAERLRTCLRATDILYRFGGDEFVMTVGHVADRDEIQYIAPRMLAIFDQPFELANETVYASASLGVAIYPDHGTTAQEILRNVDTAMYSAKERGRNQYRFYTPELTTQAVERFTTETRLRAALERDELAIYYQPIVDLRDSGVMGVEALLRWRDPKRGLVPPVQFIPSAEDSGMIQPIGAWVLEIACAQVREWHGLGLGEFQLAVNVSSRQLEHPDLVEVVRHSLDGAGLAPQYLHLEITEGMFLVLNEEVRATLSELRELGVRLAIDDFGTGYSSLSYLKRLPFKSLKIDRGFIDGIPYETDDRQIVTTIINMARDLGMEVIAEGIETRAQRQFLLSRGCYYGQGHLYAEALPTEDLERWLRLPQAKRMASKLGHGAAVQ